MCDFDISLCILEKDCKEQVRNKGVIMIEFNFDIDQIVNNMVVKVDKII